MRKTLCGIGVMLLVLLGAPATAAPGNGSEGSGEAGVEARQPTSGATRAETGEEILWFFVEVYIAIITADGPMADLLDFTTAIAVGVERSAIGNEDTPLQDFIVYVEEKYGSEAADLVEGQFEALIEELGPKLLAQVDPIVLHPAFDVDNGRPDTETVWLPTGPYILDIGNTHNVGDGEFARVVLGLIDSDEDDNDAEQLLTEFVTGTSGANLDFEWRPGIVGVDLFDISLTEFTLALEDGGTTDFLTLSGPGVEAVIAGLDTPADIVDFRSGLSLVEVGIEQVHVGRWFSNPVFDLVGRRLNTAEDVVALLGAAFSGDPRIELIGFDDSRISLVVHNNRRLSADTLILFGDIVEDVLSSLP